MRHAILGAGGVGGMIGGGLARGGDDVTFVVRPGTIASYPATLQVQSKLGDYSVPARCSEKVPEADVLWLTVKAIQLSSAIETMEKGPAPRAIVPLLNGVEHVALLRAKFGTDRVVPATIAGEIERTVPGQIVHRTPFVRLNMASRGRDLLGTALQQLQGLGWTTSLTDDEPTLLWSKLVFLAPFALSTTAAGLPIGGITGDAALNHKLEATIREACAVAAAEKATVDAEGVIALIHSMPAAMRSSMQKDVENGKQPEVDAIGGSIVRAAKRHGIGVPVVEELMTRIKG